MDCHCSTFDPPHTTITLQQLQHSQNYLNTHLPTNKQTNADDNIIIMCQQTKTISIASMSCKTTTTASTQPINGLKYNVECSRCGRPCPNGSKCKGCGTKN